MNKIRIVSKKILLNNLYSKKFINYSNKLTETARTQKGFLNSNSYFIEDIDNNFKNNIQILTISEWENKKSWDKWLKSKERENISNEFQDVLRKEKFDRLFKKNVDDIFLL